jgi:MoxR-like ATPase
LTGKCYNIFNKEIEIEIDLRRIMANKKAGASTNGYSKLFSSDALGLVDRERETKQLMYALFTREHMLMMGPAGTAKSQFATNAFSTIDGASLFQIHLTKQTTEEYVFGPLNIIELKKGNIVHNTNNSILDANFAFLDEFFDASDVLLRSLLGVLNERKWMKGAQQIKAQLHTAIVTSNYQRENEVTQAILDRIVFKCDVIPSTAKSNRVKIYQNYISQPNFSPKKLLNLVKLEEFVNLVEDPNSVKFPKQILETFDYLLEEFTKESKKYISPRTANKSLKVLKASALLDGRDEVNYSDLEELRYVFCVINRRIEEEIFDAVYEKCVGKAEEERQVMVDLDDIENKVNAMPVDFETLNDQDFINKMRELNEYIHLIEGMASPTQKTTNKRNDILQRMRQLVADNRDKLFKRNAPKSLPSNNNVAEAEVVEGEEVEPENVPF